MLQVEQHDHAELRRHAGQRDEADGARDRQVVPEQAQQPDPPTSANGSVAMISSASSKRLKVRYSSTKMISSVAGTTSFSLAVARSQEFELARTSETR